MHYFTACAKCGEEHCRSVDCNGKKLAICKGCGRKHALSNCKKCGTDHCFRTPCPEKKKGREVATSTPPIPVEQVKKGCMNVIWPSRHMPPSQAWKVKYDKNTYLLCCAHQLTGGTGEIKAKLQVGEKTYALPSSLEKCEFPFLSPDLLLLPWNLIQNPPPVPTFQICLEPLGRKEILTYVGRDPTSREFVMVGLGEYTVNNANILYSVSTGNGSCGSAIFRSANGRNEIVGIHGGTQGGGSNPNWSYRFALSERKPKN
jgi:hypothetical protein